MEGSSTRRAVLANHAIALAGLPRAPSPAARSGRRSDAGEALSSTTRIGSALPRPLPAEGRSHGPRIWLSTGPLTTRSLTQQSLALRRVAPGGARPPGCRSWRIGRGLRMTNPPPPPRAPHVQLEEDHVCLLRCVPVRPASCRRLQHHLAGAPFGGGVAERSCLALHAPASLGRPLREVRGGLAADRLAQIPRQPSPAPCARRRPSPTTTDAPVSVPRFRRCGRHPLSRRRCRDDACWVTAAQPRAPGAGCAPATVLRGAMYFW